MFSLHSKYKPTGDQPQAIERLVASIKKGNKFQTLLGVTGSGKTFTMANIIQELQRPTLVLAHNKTLAAQLAQEFKEFFPDNAVHYFVSYYDYYQPEAFVVKTGSYIEKEATINEEIDRLRHAATESLLTRRDVIIVASVSCIYGIGEVAQYEGQTLGFEVGKNYPLEALIGRLVALQFRRASADFKPGMFRVLGDILEIYPSSSEHILVLDFFGDTLEGMFWKEALTNERIEVVEAATVFPAKHFVTSPELVEEVIPLIRAELDERIDFFKKNGKLLEAERIKMKTEYDLEMLQEVGYVNGVENYSMYLSRRVPGMMPSTLLEFFPEDYIAFIDESHISIPQVGGMYAGDRARKMNLVDYGFRLPSAMENRPLKFEEFESKITQAVFVSATPSKYEAQVQSEVHEQIIRPTGLLDPLIEIEDMEYMVDSLMREIMAARGRGERSLVTTLTKKSSEELAEYLASNGVKVKYLHSEIETIERLEILRDLRMGTIEVIVGVNLLREGLDLPEVSFIGILDAEKIGFLRSTSALLQIIGRAARNSNGHVIMYSHGRKQSIAMVEAIGITTRRRAVQHQYNLDHGITPVTIVSSIKEIGLKGKRVDTSALEELPSEKLDAAIKRMEFEMDVASGNLDFERAAELRDSLIALRRKKTAIYS
jgi:excinuclease ABC subunit B